MPAVPNPLALAVMMPLVAAWSLVALAIDALRALDAALAMWLSEPRDTDERGCWL